MKNTFGNNVSITIFGESHGLGIGAVIDGLPAGILVDEDFINFQLSLRRPQGDISTPRVEADKYIIYSGVFNGYTTGTPICIVIPNENTKSKDYSEIKNKMRPSHADFTAHIKYNGFEDYRGGGHFSGRITAAIVAAGAIAINALNKKGIYIGTHISRCGGVDDTDFSDFSEDINSLNKKTFAVLDSSAEEKMKVTQNTVKKVRFICLAALIAAMYVALTYLSMALGLDKNAIQIRFSEMLIALAIVTQEIGHLFFCSHQLDILELYLANNHFYSCRNYSKS